MARSERECLAALREAAERLGKSPTKAEYEALGLTPASGTIIRVVGGWNEAKEKAGLSTEPSRGSRVGPKPDDVDLPPDTEWAELSVDQRWHYRNVAHNNERTRKRRARLRAWVNERKREAGCQDCGVDDPAVLDFHHTDPTAKTMAIVDMVTHGYGRESLRDEMEDCVVLCANCHRREHGQRREDEETRRGWLHRYKQHNGGCSRCEESDPRCLVFHHTSDEKRTTVAQMVSDGRPRGEILSEIERCELLCANCHRREHFEPPQQ
jgi:hypothetical protein